MTNLPTEGPSPIVDEEKKVSNDEVVEWLMMCWHVVLLIDDSLVTRETQQSITVEQMSEKGRPS
jgi:hypothetical protein